MNFPYTYQLTVLNASCTVAKVNAIAVTATASRGIVRS